MGINPARLQQLQQQNIQPSVIESNPVVPVQAPMESVIQETFVHHSSVSESQTTDALASNVSLDVSQSDTQPLSKVSSVRDVRPPKVQNVTKKEHTSFVCIRNFPRSLYEEAVKVFPAGKSQTDILACYVALKSGVITGLNEKQLELLRTYEQEDPYESVLKRMESMTYTTRDVLQYVKRLELLVSWMMFDTMNFRKHLPMTMQDVNVMESSMDTFLSILRHQCDDAIELETRRESRPFQ